MKPQIQPIKGRLQVAFYQQSHEECTGAYYLIRDNGEFLDVEFESHDMAHKTPLNVPIVLRGAVVDNVLLIPKVDRWYTVIEEEYAAQVARTTIKHILMAYRIKPGSSDKVKNSALAAITNRAGEVEAAFKNIAGNKWSVKVVPLVLENDTCRGTPGAYCAAQIRDLYEQNPIEGVTPRYYHLVNEPHDRYCGQATLGGSAGVTYRTRNGLCGVDTTIHELGHNFGLMHGQLLRPGGEVIEYGDPSTWMGNSKSRNGFNACNYIQLDLVESKDIGQVFNSAEVLLCPVELKSLSIRAGEERVALGLTPGRNKNNLALSTRKIKGDPFAQHNLDEQRLYIHEYNRPASRAIESLVEGESFTLRDENKDKFVKITFVELVEETVRARVEYFNDTMEPEELTITPGMPDIPVSMTPTTAVNGTWYNKNHTRQGFEFRVVDDQFCLIWYTYQDGNRSGRRYFITEVANIDDVDKDLDIYTTEGTTFADPKSRETTFIGKCKIQFINEQSAIFHFNTEEHGRGSIELEQLSKSVHPRDGWFYDPERAGEGFTFHTLSEDTTIMYWYTYGLRRNPYGRFIEEQEWLFTELKLVNGRWTGDIFKVDDGRFLKWDNVPIVETRGGVEVTFNEDNIQVDYTEEDFGGGIITAWRIF